MHNTPVSHSPLARALGLLKLMRPMQWIKNGFVLAPLFFSARFFDLVAVNQALLAFGLFCIAASATYIVNDMRDIEHDRRHPEKLISRPLASGLVNLPTALILLIFLYGILIFAWFFVPLVMMVVTGYIVLNLAYSFFLKHQPVVDIFTIAIGFVLRVYAGALAIDVPLSAWMFVTTLCLALYLASIKRRQELSKNGSSSRRVLNAYSVPLIDRYAEMSATGALLFYSMFVMSAKPQLVITVPLVLFGLFRYWYVVEQLDGGESPTDALFADWQLLLTVLLWVAACAWELWPGTM
ncbi:MAG: decaprenyl-phosphate phosphoribosyltransferase [Gammaproteobacteria bacterium]|nr:decaprenyl-phosphate phosphoribosyltransferase [Gammaproteobacteria bacterium]